MWPFHHFPPTYSGDSGRKRWKGWEDVGRKRWNWRESAKLEGTCRHISLPRLARGDFRKLILTGAKNKLGAAGRTSGDALMSTTNDGAHRPPLRQLSLFCSALGFRQRFDGYPDIHPRQWTGISITSWWDMISGGSTPNRKALASPTLLTTWEIRNESSARIFHNKHASINSSDKIAREKPGCGF
jgi:hypothetical protein